MSVPKRAATPARAGLLVAALAVLSILAVQPLVDPTGARAMGPLPACRYDDILTSPRSYVDWSKTLVDTILRVTKSYIPPDLVSVSEAGIPGKGQVRAIMIDDLRAMTAAAKAAGSGIGVQSPYRSYTTQEAVFQRWVEVYGRKKALTLSARPGHSEHQLGTAIDFRSSPVDTSTLSGSWAGTPAGIWMKAHAWEYGFVMSYPKGKTALTCYAFEPWHFHYVGRTLAARIHDSGLTPRQYLWAHFTTTVVPPAPSATAVATKTAAPSQSALPAPSALPSITAPSPHPVGTAAPTAAVGPASPNPTSAPIAIAIPDVGDPAAAQTALVVSGFAVIAAGALVVLSLNRRRGRSRVGL